MAWSFRLRTTGIAAALLAASCAPVSGAGAEIQQEAAPAAKLMLSETSRAAAANGRISMIVMLAADPTEPRDLAATKAASTAAVTSFLQRIEARKLLGGNPKSRVSRTYDYAPYAVMDLTLAEALSLATEPAVRSIVENEASEPSPARTGQ